MISMAFFLLLLGLIVFGPRKTIEMAQSAGEMLGKVKHATAHFQSQMSNEIKAQDGTAGAKSCLTASEPERTQSGTPMPR